MKIKLLLAAFFALLVFFVSNQQSHAQASVNEVVGGEGTITRQKIEDCLSNGGNASECAHVGKSYMDSPECGSFCAGGGNIDESNCNEFTCTVTCNNGISITINLPPPTDTPTQPPAKCSPVGNYCSFGTQLCVCKDDGTTECNPCTSGVCTGTPGSAQCTSTTPTVTTSTPPVTTNTPPVTTNTPPVTTGTPPVTTGTPPVTTGTPPVNVTPTPPFNDSMCKCESMDFTPITLGSTTTVTAYGKVEGTDTQFAKIPSFNFIFYAGTDASAQAVKRETVPATQIENTVTKDRYKSVWALQIPSSLDPKKVYRIQAKPTCVKKTAAIESPVAMQISQTQVLGTTTEDVGFFGRIFQFFAGLFGRGNNTDNNASVQSTGENVPNQQPNLQIGSFKPLVAEKQTDADNCTFIRFQFAQ